MSRRFGLTWLTLAALGCASTPYQQPMNVSPVVPGAGEQVVVDQAMILFDSSGSISRTEQFPGEKALLEAFVASMPEAQLVEAVVGVYDGDPDRLARLRDAYSSFGAHLIDPIIEPNNEETQS